MSLTVYGVGNLTEDPQLTYTSSGAGVCNCTIAFNRSYKSGDEWRSEVTFVRVKLWDNNAEKFTSLCKKGDGVSIEGRVQQKSWQTEEGQTRTYLYLHIFTFAKIEKTKKQDTAVAQPAVQHTTVAPPAVQPSQPRDNDVPF